MSVGDMVKHPDHKEEVQITQIDGDMIAFTAKFPTGGGLMRFWAHRQTFTERSWL